AIIRDPVAFLMDEPLSNLDALLRVQMRTELLKLHRRVGKTTVYVTHDQIEAMTMGDRICVMKDGNVMQVDEPLRLYNHPQNMFVAAFIGSPAMNFFNGALRRAGNHLSFVETNAKAAPITFQLSESLAAKAAGYVDKPIVLGIRPEDVQDSRTVSAPNPAHTIDVTVEVSEPMGSETYLYLDTGAHSFIARVRASDRFEAGLKIKVTVLIDNAHLFDATTTQVLR
ncbi:MAG: ABC transporter ATP-binding protein, partial [Verrucomicrobia bacterium]|nr:ABC transporter ATP-binding protein [Verrucomicrobiota bacterium]